MPVAHVHASHAQAQWQQSAQVLERRRRHDGGPQGASCSAAQFRPASWPAPTRCALERLTCTLSSAWKHLFWQLVWSEGLGGPSMEPTDAGVHPPWLACVHHQPRGQQSMAGGLTQLHRCAHALGPSPSFAFRYICTVPAACSLAVAASKAAMLCTRGWGMRAGGGREGVSSPQVVANWQPL